MRHKAIIMSAIAVAVLLAASLTVLLPAEEGGERGGALGSSECPVLANDITGLPTAATVGTPLVLAGTASPSNAAYTDIIWSVKTAGTTGASISGGNSFNATAAGTATLTATIEQGFTDIKMVAAGSAHTVAIRDDGTLWAWGYNYYGQLGDGSTTQRNTPVQVGTDNDWSQVAAGYGYTVAIKDDGTLWAWGDNENGQLGNGTSGALWFATTPVQEATMSDNWSFVSAGYDHTVAIKDDGTLWSWGYNAQGALGNGDSGSGKYEHTPVQEATMSDNWSYASGGSVHTVAIKTNGELWTWGYNSYGQIGNGDSGWDKFIDTPFRVGTDEWSYAAAGYSHTVAIRDDGTLWAWGSNDVGQLGDGTRGASALKTAPVQEVSGGTDWSYVSAGYDHTVAIRDDGTLWVWGSNNFGQLGDGSSGGDAGSHTPILIDRANMIKEFSITVTAAVPAAPVITSGNNTSIVYGAGSTFTVTSTGSPARTYSLTGTVPAGVSINATTGVMSIASSTAVGVHSFTVNASNGVSPDATQSFTLTVTAAPAAPVITSGNNTSVVYGEGGTFDVTSTGNPAVTYSLTGAPAGVTINVTTGVMTIASSTDAGVHTFKLIASNGVSPDAEEVFTLTVRLAPAITSANNTSAEYGATKTFNVTATGDTTITYSLTGAPAGVTINATTGVMSIASSTAAGAHTFTVTASNGVSPNATQSFTLTVTAPPAITSANSINVVSGAGGTFTVTSIGHPARTYSLTGHPAGVTINASTGVITVASSTEVGEYIFTVTASNGISPDVTQTFTLNITEKSGGEGGNSTTMIILIILLILAVIAGVTYYVSRKKS